MLQFETGLFVKNNMIMQRITVECCIASAEMINNVLKRLPFDASVVQSSRDGKNKETVIFITPPISDHLYQTVSLDTIQGIEVTIKKVVTNCQKASKLLRELDNFTEALIKDCKPFEHETTKSNSSTAKKESDFR